jgi:DnaJ-class molecular chaperone
VLSDKHERAWYDGHRDQILRSGERHQAGGGGGYEGPQKPGDEEDLYEYFSAACYSGYGDGPKARRRRSRCSGGWRGEGRKGEEGRGGRKRASRQR